jgi:uncharacterized YigZ family protein
MSSLFSDTYYEILQDSETSLREKGSRFLAFSFKVYDEIQVKEKLYQLKMRFPDASHHCYAYVLGQGQEAQKSQDDGEPSNSAGRPILRAILSQELTFVLVVVVRYFGGTLLGIPGLISAYGESAKSVLLISQKVQKFQEDLFEIIADFESETAIHQKLKSFEHRIVDRSYVNRVVFIVAVRRSQLRQFELMAEEAYPLQIKSF